jgi:phosphonate transport system substrate-binding protein
MFKNTLLIITTVFSFLFLIAGPLPAQEKEKLVIAIQPTTTPEQLSSQAKELKTYLRERLDRDVEIFFPTSYAGVIEALRFGHAHAAFMGAWPAVLALAKADADIVLAEIREVFVDGKKVEAPYYFSYWVVLPESPYQSLEDLRERKVAFSSPLSSSGYVAPLSRLVELGFVSRPDNRPADAKDFFKEVRFAGGYAQGWEALKAGQVDVALIAGDVSEALYQDVLSNTRIIEKQGPIPSHAVVTAADISPDLRTDLVEALLGLNEDEYRPLMRKFVSGIFVRFAPASEDHVAPFKRMVEMTGLEFMDKK